MAIKGRIKLFKVIKKLVALFFY